MNWKVGGINLDIYENEFVTLLGPSGCGKTTLLRILGGFLEPDEGQVIFDGKDITQLPAYKRDLNTVFQKYALFPHMNVYDKYPKFYHAIGIHPDEIKNYEYGTQEFIDYFGKLEGCIDKTGCVAIGG